MAVGIVGLGYVGLPLAVAMAEAGCEVVAVDRDSEKIAMLRSGSSWIEDVESARIEAVLHRLEVTQEPEPLRTCDAIVICVPTPLTKNREPDLSALVAASTAIGEVLTAGTLVVLESTTYPGTTREVVLPLLERGSGLVAGESFHLAFSPERVDPGRVGHSLRNTPKVIGGLTPRCLEAAVAFYGRACDELVPVTSPEVAELSKLLENIFRTVNIALVNELAILADRMGIDIWETIDAAATKPYGFMRFDPGPGMGGHCLPVDPFYLAWRARSFDMSTEFIELAGKVNQQMPDHCVHLVERALNDRALAVRGSRVLLLGVAYKPGLSDTRESPALKLIALLQQRGAEIAYHDPYVPELHHEGLRSTQLAEGLDGADLVIILTAHPGIDYAALVASGAALLDLRGVTRVADAPHVSRL